MPYYRQEVVHLRYRGDHRHSLRALGSVAVDSRWKKDMLDTKLTRNTDLGGPVRMCPHNSITIIYAVKLSCCFP